MPIKHKGGVSYSAVLLYYTVIMMADRISANTFRVSFTFQHYINPTNGSMDNPDCCDLGPFSQNCYTPCETVFKICLRSGDTSTTDTACSLTAAMTSGIIASSDIQFYDTVGTLSNPILFDLETLPQSGIQAYIEIEDDDEGSFDDDLRSNTPDLIDEIFVRIPANSVGVAGQTRTYAGIHNIAMLNLEYSLSCAQSNYYGPDCATFCVPMNNPANGHYTCDPTTGAKICNNGFTDPATNCINAIISTTTTATTIATISSSEPSSVIIYSTQSRSTPINSQTTKSDSSMVSQSSLSHIVTQTSKPIVLVTRLSTSLYSSTQSSSIPTSNYGVTNTFKNDFGILAGSVGSIALVLILALTVSVTAIVSLVVFRRRKKTQARSKGGFSPSTSSTDPLTNPAYSGVDLTLYQPLQPETLDTCVDIASYQQLQPKLPNTKNVYMTLESPKHTNSTPEPALNNKRVHCPLNRSNKTQQNNKEPITSAGQEYAMLYETPIDGAASNAQTHIVIQAEMTKPTEYSQPIDHIVPCGQILIKMEDQPPVAET